MIITSKLSKKFIKGLEKINLTLEEVQIFFIYVGGNIGNKISYFEMKYGHKNLPPYKPSCICGVKIKENCYIHDTRNSYDVDKIYIIGNCCIKTFLPEGRSGKTCMICVKPHRNRKHDLCNVCRKIYKNEVDIEKIKITFGKHKGTFVKDIPKSYAIWLYSLDPEFLGNRLKNLLKYYFKFVD